MHADQFDGRKKDILAFSVDKSPKGSIDEPVIPLLNVINRCKHFVTTSSCSGRVALYVDADPNSFEKVKKGGIWISVFHEPLPAHDTSILWRALFPNHTHPDSISFLPSCTPSITDPIIYFKFEPFILHVLTRNNQAAEAFLGTALSAGYANSGIQKGHVQVRGTLKLDVPIGNYVDGKIVLCVSKEYVDFLCQLANEKFAENFQKLRRFEERVDRDFLNVKDRTKPPVETREQRKERKRREGLVKAAELKAEKEKHIIENQKLPEKEFPITY